MASKFPEQDNAFDEFGAGSIGDSVIKPRDHAKKDVTGKNAGRDLTGENPSYGTGSLNDGVVKMRDVPNADADRASTPDSPVNKGEKITSNKGNFASVVTSGGLSFGQKGD